jgi:NADH dehydrogenase
MSMAPRPRVVVIGGGFGGLYAARALRDAPADVTVIDRTNHHVFQPLLYQVATATLTPTDIYVTIRGCALAAQYRRPSRRGDARRPRPSRRRVQ